MDKPSFCFPEKGNARSLCHGSFAGQCPTESGAVGLGAGRAVGLRGLTPRGAPGGPPAPVSLYLLGMKGLRRA